MNTYNYDKNGNNGVTNANAWNADAQVLGICFHVHSNDGGIMLWGMDRDRTRCW